MTDRWTRWLLHDRHGGDAVARERLLAQLAPIRDRVLDGAELGGDETVLDLGCGDGLIGFGALSRLSARGVVIFSDVSAPLIERCHEIAAELGELDRCRFLVTSADQLDAVDDASVDAVTARSVLLYQLDDPTFAPAHRDAWLAWATRSRLRPFVRLARTIRRHRTGILTAIRLGLTNGRLEGLNSRIRLISHRSFGFHSADPHIALVYLCCTGIGIDLPQ